MKQAAWVSLGGVLVLAAAAGATPMDDPFGYFHVYSLANIGRPDAKYHSDFQGVAGAAGNVYFSSFSLHGNGSTTPYCLHTGGSATLTGAYLRGLEIGGDAHLGSFSVGGDVIAGGSIGNFGGGSITGDARAAGSVALSGSVAVHGETASGAAFEPVVDHAVLSSFFRQTSADIGALAATGGVTNQWGNLVFTGTSGTNVAWVDAATLKSAWGFTIIAPDDATVYVNVTGDDVELDWTGWNYLGGVRAENVLLNMPEATGLTLRSTNAVNLLAPWAETDFASGLLVGSLIVGDLQGGGQVNLGHFDQPPSAIPEPVTLASLALGGVILLVRSRRR